MEWSDCNAVLCVLLLWLTRSAAGSEWTFTIAGSNHTYTYIERWETLTTAINTCNNIGAYVLQLETMDEESKIQQSLITANKYNPYWLGLKRVGGDWYWNQDTPGVQAPINDANQRFSYTPPSEARWATDGNNIRWNPETTDAGTFVYICEEGVPDSRLSSVTTTSVPPSTTPVVTTTTKIPDVTTLTSKDTSYVTTLTSEDTSDVTTLTSEDTSYVTTLTSEDTSDVTTLTSEDTSYVTTLTSEDTSYVTTLTSEDTSYVTTLTSKDTSYVTTLTSEDTSYVTTLTSKDTSDVTTLTSEDTSDVTTLTSEDTSYDTTLTSEDTSYVTTLTSEDTSDVTTLTPIETSDVTTRSPNQSSDVTTTGVERRGHLRRIDAGSAPVVMEMDNITVARDNMACALVCVLSSECHLIAFNGHSNVGQCYLFKLGGSANGPFCEDQVCDIFEIVP